MVKADSVERLRRAPSRGITILAGLLLWLYVVVVLEEKKYRFFYMLARDREKVNVVCVNIYQYIFKC
jgi:hypothetical protein